MHFQSKLHENSILTGLVDSYCLVCDNYLRSQDEAFLHTEKPIHKKNMRAATRVEKFLSDNIIKVKKGYYCPFCNVLLSTTTKVSIHIKDSNHEENKGAQMLSLVGNNILAFNEVFITLESWNGMMENTCVICNTDFGNENEHRMEQSHMLRLVQGKCEFGDKYVYRKVDEDSFFCLTCRSVFSMNEKLSHHQNNSHKDRYNLAKQLNNSYNKTIQEMKIDPPKLDTINTPIKVATKPIDIKNVKKDDPIKPKSEIKLSQSPAKNVKTSDNSMNVTKNTVLAEASDNETHSDILDRVDKFQKKGINIDFTWERARCNVCHEVMPFEVAAIEQHIEARHTIKNKIDNIETKIDLKKELDNDVKLVTKTGNNIETKINFKTQPKELDNDVKLVTKTTDNNVIPKVDTKKIDKAESKLSTKKQRKRSEYSNELKANAQKQHKKSENSKKIKTDSKKTHIEMVSKQTKTLNNGLNLDNKMELETFAKQNNMIVMQNEAYCRLCKVGISLNMAAINEHANLSFHKAPKKPGHTAISGNRVLTSEYMETFIRVESNLGSDIILNNKYALRQHSFHCIIIEDEGYKCVLCDTDFTKASDQLIQHMNEPDHKTKMGFCKIVSSMPEEFIREITSNMYHCGYCNEVLEGWPEMEEHLSRSRHLYARHHAQWNLKRCHSVIRNARLMQVSSMYAIDFA